MGVWIEAYGRLDRAAGLRSFAQAARPGLREPGLRHSARRARHLFVARFLLWAIEAGDRGVAGRAAVPRGPYEQGIGPMMAVWAAHTLMHQ